MLHDSCFPSPSFAWRISVVGSHLTASGEKQQQRHLGLCLCFFRLSSYAGRKPEHYSHRARIIVISSANNLVLVPAWPQLVLDGRIPGFTVLVSDVVLRHGATILGVSLCGKARATLLIIATREIPSPTTHRLIGTSADTSFYYSLFEVLLLT